MPGPGRPGVSTTKSLFASTVAFRPGSHDSDITSTPSVDVSGWEDADSHHSRPTAVSELDRPIDLTGHVLSPFYIRNINCAFNVLPFRQHFLMLDVVKVMGMGFYILITLSMVLNGLVYSWQCYLTPC